MIQPVPASDVLAFPVRDAARVLGVGVTKVRELIASGELGSIRVSRRLLVPRQALETFIAERLDAGPGGSHPTSSQKSARGPTTRRRPLALDGQ